MPSKTPPCSSKDDILPWRAIIQFFSSPSFLSFPGPHRNIPDYNMSDLSGCNIRANHSSYFPISITISVKYPSGLARGRMKTSQLANKALFFSASCFARKVAVAGLIHSRAWIPGDIFCNMAFFDPL